MRGRTPTKLTSDEDLYCDALFEADRLDGRKIKGKTFRHTTFANTSFKDVVFENCIFENVVFLSAYFRGAKFLRCEVKASRFINCDLMRVSLVSSDIRFYNSFRGCFVPFERLKESLPREGNLLRDLASNLADEATLQGATRDANKYREQAIHGDKEFLKAVVLQQQPFYKEKYNSVDRVEHALRYFRIKLFEGIWGRARRLEVIVRNWFLVAAFWAIIVLITGVSVIRPEVEWYELALIGFFSVSPIDVQFAYVVDGTAMQLFLLLGRILGFVFSAMFVALLFARIYEGRRS